MTVLSSQSCALPEGLRYYLLRDNVMVPMVPVDQLPFQLQGVPRQLDHRQLSEQRWKFVGETNEPASPLLMLSPTGKLSSQPKPAVRPRFLAPDHYVRAESTSAHIGEPRTARLCLLPSLSATEGASDLSRSVHPVLVEHPTSLADSFASIYQKNTQRLKYRTPYPSGIEPDPSRKEYCTHWIKTGECAFISIGCKYKHEMPTSEKLRELGFTQGLPKWWKEKSALGARGLTWMQRRLAGSADRALTGEISAPRAFPESKGPRMIRDALRPLDEGFEHPHSVLERERGVATRKAAREDAAEPHVISMQDLAPTTTKAIKQVQNLLIDIEETPAPPPSPQLSHSSLSSAEALDMQISCEHVSILSPLTPTTEGETFFKTIGVGVPKTDEAESPKTTEDKLMITDEQTSPKTNRYQYSRVSNGLTKENTHTAQPCIRRYSETTWASSSDEDVKPKKPISKRKPIINKPPKGAFAKRAPSKQSGLAVSKHADQNTNAEHDCKNANRKLLQHKVVDAPVPELQADIAQPSRTGHQKERARRGAVSAESRTRTMPAAVVPVTRMAV